MKMKRILFSTTLLLLLLGAGVAYADYTIGVDDVLDVVFWQQPELNQTVTVNADGMISLSVAGEITAAGLTPSELGRKIVEHVSRFNRDISQAVVTVTQYNSNTVFVEGEVASPGRYAREVIPDLWTIIKEMGGATENADLRNVKIIRGGKVDQGKIITVDVLDAVTKKDVASLPRVYPHDIIRVGRLPTGVPGGSMRAESEKRRNIYYVTGAVSHPGAYTLEPGTDIIEALAVAGGYSNSADLKKIRVSSKVDDYSNVYRINLDRQMKKGDVPRYILQPEDAIVVLEKSGGLFGTGFSVLRDVVTMGGSIASFILLFRRANN